MSSGNVTNDYKQTANNNPATQPQTKQYFALSKQNYLLIAISFLLVIIGFILMIGSGTTETTYNPDIFSTRRIVIAPAIAFIGFVCMLFAILRKPKQ